MTRPLDEVRAEVVSPEDEPEIARIRAEPLVSQEVERIRIEPSS